MTVSQVRATRGRTLKGFGVVPWLVWATAVLTMLALLFLPEASGPILTYLFPIWAVGLTLGAFQTGENLMAPVYAFPVLYLIWFWLGSINLLPSADLPTTLLDAMPSREWFYCLVGFVGYLGAVLFSGKPRSKVERLLGYRPVWDGSRFLVILAVFFGITMAAWAIITVQEGIPIFRADVSDIRVSLPDRHHLNYQIEIIGANFLLPLLFLYRWSTRPRAIVNAAIWTISLVLFFVLISQGNRGMVLPPLLTILFMRHILVKPWKLRWAIPAGLAGMSLIGVTGYYRAIQHYGDTFIDNQTRLGVPPVMQPYADIYFYIRAPLSTFRDAMQLIPAVHGYQWGALSFGAFLQVLPGRHPSSDYFFKDLLGHTFLGFGEPASMLGTFYADFGGVGVLVGMMFVGILASQLFRTVIVSSRVHWLLIYAYYVEKLIGGLYGSLFEYIIELLLPIAWFLILKYFAQPSSSRTAVRAPITRPLTPALSTR